MCNQINNIDLVEDEGGQIISFSHYARMTITTASENLVVNAQSSDESLLLVEENGVCLLLSRFQMQMGQGCVSVA